MQGSPVDQARQDPNDDVADNVSEQMRAQVQPLSRSEEHEDPSGALWFAVGAGISTAVIAVAVAVS